MTSLSTHILDTESGKPAGGIKVELYRRDELVASGETDDDGRIRQLADGLAPDVYRIVFHPDSPFFRRIELEVQIEPSADTLHVPLLISPYACTSYRGS
jgi:5-hydroxyisourate hydrolase